MVNQDLKSLGDSLRVAREGKNLTLKEVENATSIRTSCLKAIEEGEPSKLISPVYAQGFVKQYANFLGMNCEELIANNQGFFGRVDKQEFTYGIGTLEARGYPSSQGRWLPLLGYAVSIAAILIAAWYFARSMGLL